MRFNDMCSQKKTCISRFFFLAAPQMNDRRVANKQLTRKNGYVRKTDYSRR